MQKGENDGAGHSCMGGPKAHPAAWARPFIQSKGGSVPDRAALLSSLGQTFNASASMNCPINERDRSRFRSLYDFRLHA